MTMTMTIGAIKIFILTLKSNLCPKMSTFALNFTFTYTIKGNNAHFKSQIAIFNNFLGKKPLKIIIDH